MSIRTSAEFDGLARVGRVVALALRKMANQIRPGITTGELDEVGATILKQHGAQSAPQLCVGFPAATCISVNNEVAHGIPGDRIVQAGDIVNIDVSAELNGFFADTGASFPVPPVKAQNRELCRRTKRALKKALKVMTPGQRMNRTGKEIEREAQRAGLYPIHNLCAHGVGRWLHEEPKEISNFFDPRDRRRFSEGLVVAMETFISLGTSLVVEEPNGWTMSTDDGSWAAQYEHTVVVTRKGPVILTQP